MKKENRDLVLFRAADRYQGVEKPKQAAELSKVSSTCAMAKESLGRKWYYLHPNTGRRRRLTFYVVNCKDIGRFRRNLMFWCEAPSQCNVLCLVNYGWSSVLLGCLDPEMISSPKMKRRYFSIRKGTLFCFGLFVCLFLLFCFLWSLPFILNYSTLGEFSASDSSLTDIQEQRRQPMPDPGLMPLPDSASDLDWSNLVDAAKAFEGKFSEYNT